MTAYTLELHSALLSDCWMKILVAFAGVLGGIAANQAIRFWQTRFGNESSPPNLKRQEARRRSRLVVLRMYLDGKSEGWFASLDRLIQLHRTERQILEAVRQMQPKHNNSCHLLTGTLLDLLNAEGDSIYQHPVLFEESERSLLETLAGKLGQNVALKQQFIADASRLAVVVRQLYEYQISLCTQLAHHELREAATGPVLDMGEVMRNAIRRLERRVSCVGKKVLASQEEISAQIDRNLTHVASEVSNGSRQVANSVAAPQAQMPQWFRPIAITGGLTILLLLASQIVLLVRMLG